ncbi:hypothetical protein J437_LFUL001042 [Ladona fulva]|uniref:EGF-like domain-containing protein n=1 Tax=Ladona fulva TaxID=123851 RepID=A0A8K0P4P6_LADFU|nr:hypothetical protein J437_LFUL001042 [Ladona fulva]
MLRILLLCLDSTLAHQGNSVAIILSAFPLIGSVMDFQTALMNRMNQNYVVTVRTCGSTDFRCNGTGRCIPLTWVCDEEKDCLDGSDENSDRNCSVYYCDGDADCEDRSDEEEGCIPSECHSTEFLCKNNHCIPAPWVCNGFDDCGDGSDENKDHCTNSSECADGMFRCKNKLCINNTLTCDGENDCGDFSDERQCNVNECETPGICAHECIDLQIGYKCKCYPGFEQHPEQSNLCQDIDECAGGVTDWLELGPKPLKKEPKEERRPPSPCSQLCHNTHGSYVCSCVTGYVLRGDKHSCKANACKYLCNFTKQMFLYFAASLTIL